MSNAGAGGPGAGGDQGGFLQWLQGLAPQAQSAIMRVMAQANPVQPAAAADSVQRAPNPLNNPSPVPPGACRRRSSGARWRSAAYGHAADRRRSWHGDAIAYRHHSWRRKLGRQRRSATRRARRRPWQRNGPKGIHRDSRGCRTDRARPRPHQSSSDGACPRGPRRRVAWLLRANDRQRARLDLVALHGSQRSAYFSWTVSSLAVSSLTK